MAIRKKITPKGAAPSIQNFKVSKDHTLFATIDGVVEFSKGRANRSFVSIVPVA